MKNFDINSFRVAGLAPLAAEIWRAFTATKPTGVELEPLGVPLVELEAPFIMATSDGLVAVYEMPVSDALLSRIACFRARIRWLICRVRAATG